MLSGPFTHARILTGPTGAGKSALAIELAGAVGGEIISVDSMALYRGMDIGTAKPSLAERVKVPHRLIDVLEPWQSASVAWWLEQATLAAEDIVARGKTPLLVGGTPLYLKALIFGLFDGPAADETLRAALAADAEREGVAALHRRLQTIDPKAAAKIHVNDVRRVIRALEVHALTGRPISDWQTEWAADPQPTPQPTGQMICVDWPREELFRRIDERVDTMFASGLVEEVAGLLKLEKPLSREANQALGYREVIAHLRGGPSLAETIDAVKTHSRQFAKRQMTWFRRLPCRFVPANAVHQAAVSIVG